MVLATALFPFALLSSTVMQTLVFMGGINMNREEFMALESPKKAEALNALIAEGKSQKEAMMEIGVSIKDLMMTQVFFSKTEGKFAANAVGGFSNFHSDSTGDAMK